MVALVLSCVALMFAVSAVITSRRARRRYEDALARILQERRP